MNKYINTLVILSSFSLHAFEVNTHQGLTRCAISNECSQIGAKNLEAFVTHTKILNEDYQDEYFEGYTHKGKKSKYIEYIEEAEEAIHDYQIFVKGDYKGMIEAGAVLEDAIYHDADNKADGRFNNHFYSAQFESKEACEAKFDDDPEDEFVAFDYSDILSPRALCLGYGRRTDNISWALQDGVTLDKGRTNEYGIHDAFDYFKRSFSGLKKSDSDRYLSNLEIREKYQAKRERGDYVNT